MQQRCGRFLSTGLYLSHALEWVANIAVGLRSSLTFCPARMTDGSSICGVLYSAVRTAIERRSETDHLSRFWARSDGEAKLPRCNLSGCPARPYLAHLVACDTRWRSGRVCFYRADRQHPCSRLRFLRRKGDPGRESGCRARTTGFGPYLTDFGHWGLCDQGHSVKAAI